MAAVRAIMPRLFVAGPAWLPEDEPAFHRWLMKRAGWGRDHPCNPPFPGPIPAAYLDLLLAHPDASVGGHTCASCGIPVPSTRASGEPGVDYRWPEPLATTCPVCGVPVVPPRRV